VEEASAVRGRRERRGLASPSVVDVVVVVDGGGDGDGDDRLRR
jgi:hypothetical protein